MATTQAEHQSSKRFKPIIKGKGPEEFRGVTVSDEGEIFAADRPNNRIQVFNLQGKCVPEFPTSPTLLMPHDVTMDGEGNLWVVGSTDSAVKYNKQGKKLTKFDLQKTESDRGVAMDTRRNLILITQTTGEWNNKQGEVQVFTPDGKLVGTVGQQQGMKYPQYITVDREGNILVSDRTNHCVYVYNEYGHFQFKFGGEGSGEGQLRDPRGICTYNVAPGYIIVADKGNNRVEMFDKTGKFIKHIGTDIPDPCAVAIAPLGQLIVTDDTYTGYILDYVEC